MAEGFSIAVNSTAFEGALIRIQDGVRKGFIDPQFGTLGVQGRLLAERCQDFTPPRNLGQGRAAVARDLQRIYQPLDERTFTSKSLKRIVREDLRTDWNAASKNFSGSLRNTLAVGFSTGLHTQNQNNRGRTPAKGLGIVTLGQEATSARRYAQQVAKMVGWARSGWNAAITGLGGAIRAKWMDHGTAGGSLVDGRAGPDPFVQGINSTGWARNSGEGDRILHNAINARIRDMEAYAIRMSKLAVEKVMGHAA